MFKLFAVTSIAIGVMIASSHAIYADQFNMADKNPQVVAHYEDGPHGKPSEPGGNHEGEDLVKQNGKSGSFQAWFYGTFPADGQGEHGHHSVWKVSKDGTCPSNATLVVDANPGWGDYLVAGADYCVFDNTFKKAK